MSMPRTEFVCAGSDRTGAAILPLSIGRRPVAAGLREAGVRCPRHNEPAAGPGGSPAAPCYAERGAARTRAGHRRTCCVRRPRNSRVVTPPIRGWRARGRASSSGLGRESGGKARDILPGMSAYISDQTGQAVDPPEEWVTGFEPAASCLGIRKTYGIVLPSVATARFSPTWASPMIPCARSVHGRGTRALWV